jgi:adenosine deaminase
MSGVTLSHELEVLHAQTGLGTAELAAMERAAAEASFLPRAARDAALAQLAAGWPST